MQLDAVFARRKSDRRHSRVEGDEEDERRDLFEGITRICAGHLSAKGGGGGRGISLSVSHDAARTVREER